jgi:hypothetical protein
MARGKKRNSPLKFIDERQLKIKPAAGLDLENERLVVKKAADLMSPFYNVLATHGAGVGTLHPLALECPTKVD